MTVHTSVVVIVRRLPGPAGVDPDADGLDPFGDPILAPAGSSSPPAGEPLEQRIAVPDSLLTTVTTSETERERDTVTTDRVWRPPAGTDVRAADEVEIPGEAGRWRVIGQPVQRRHAFTGHRPRLRVLLRRTEG